MSVNDSLVEDKAPWAEDVQHFLSSAAMLPWSRQEIAVQDLLSRSETIFMREEAQDGSQEIVISSDPAEARRVQDDIEQALLSQQYDEREVFSIKLALEEALINAIKHGNQMDRNKKVLIRYRIQSERFDVRIIDEGKGFNPEDVPDPMAVENLERPCGRGLLLIRHYMTEVVYHPPGNRLSMSMIRNPHRNGKK
jgi:serine/threonine-protein kinase RsbW